MKTKTKLPLLAYNFRWIGVIFLVIGFIFFYLYFIGGKPDYFETKVYAVYSSYLKSRHFVMAKTNLLDELGSTLSILGIMLISFSKEKNEKDQIYNELRLRAVIWSVYITTFLWVLTFAFIFGWPIFILSSIIFVVFQAIYFCIFQSSLRKLKSEK